MIRHDLGWLTRSRRGRGLVACAVLGATVPMALVGLGVPFEVALVAIVGIAFAIGWCVRDP